jgi:phosphoribosylanthranilate isomerase
VVDAVAGRAITVGIVVNQSPAAVAELRRHCGVDLLQLHGDEPDDEVRVLGGWAIKVFRRSSLPDGRDFALFPDAWGFLLDRWHPTTYGGAGAAWDYPRLPPGTTRRPVLLAGGWTPETVRSGIEQTRPWGVDVCSGVESAPGRKDPDRMRRFFDEACHAQIPTPA